MMVEAGSHAAVSSNLPPCQRLTSSAVTLVCALAKYIEEAKGPDGSAAVAERQACYKRTLGARGIHAHQLYQQSGLRQ